MADIVPEIEARIVHPHCFGYSDGETYLYGTGYGWRIGPDWIASQSGGYATCEIWPRQSQDGEEIYVCTLARTQPSGNMSLSAWTQVSGTWVARTILNQTWLAHKNSGGTSGEIRSNAVMNTKNGIVVSVVQCAPISGGTAGVEIALGTNLTGDPNLWKIIIPTFGVGTKASAYFDYSGTLTYSGDFASTATQEQKAREFSLIITFVEGAMYLQIMGLGNEGEKILLKRDDNPILASSGYLRVKLVGTAGAVWAKDVSWNTSGVVQPPFGLAIGSGQNSSGMVGKIAKREPGGTSISGATTAYSAGGVTHHLPQLTLTGDGTRTPYLYGASLATPNQLGPMNTAQDDLRDLCTELELDYTMRDKGSEATLVLHGVDPADINDKIRYNARVIMKCRWSDSADENDLVDEIEGFTEYPSSEADEDQPGYRRVTLKIGDWATTRLKTKKMIFMPAAYGYTWSEFIQYVLDDRFNVPSTHYSIEDDGFTVEGSRITLLQFRQELDGAEFLDQMIALRPGWRWWIQQPGNLITVERVPQGVPTDPADLTIDDAATSDPGKFVKRLHRDMDLSKFVTKSKVDCLDDAGRRTVGAFNFPGPVNSGARRDFVGDHQEAYQEVDVKIDPAAAAFRLIGDPDEGYPISWEQEHALFGMAYVGQVVEVGDIADCDIQAGERFEIVEKTVRIHEANADMTVIGRQFFQA